LRLVVIGERSYRSPILLPTSAPTSKRSRQPTTLKDEHYRHPTSRLTTTNLSINKTPSPKPHPHQTTQNGRRRKDRSNATSPPTSRAAKRPLPRRRKYTTATRREIHTLHKRARASPTIPKPQTNSPFFSPHRKSTSTASSAQSPTRAPPSPPPSRPVSPTAWRSTWPRGTRLAGSIWDTCRGVLVLVGCKFVVMD
jgi:hypothetical protein